MCIEYNKVWSLKLTKSMPMNDIYRQATKWFGITDSSFYLNKPSVNIKCYVIWIDVTC